MNTLTRLALAGLSLATLLAGCSSPRIHGRVVEGPIGVVAVVEAKDERLKGPGVPGVDLELRASSTTASRSIADGTSGPDGSFSLPLSSGQSLADQLRLTAKASGYVTTQGITFIPGDGRELLVVLKRSDGRATPAGTPDAQTRTPTADR